jgi:hypothetical protein
LRVAERQLNQFTDLSHLFPAATNIIVANLVQVALLILSLDGLTLAVNNRVLCNDTVLWGIDFHHLEFNLSHTTSDGKCITDPQRTVGFAEVGGKVDIEERAGKTLDGIGDGEHSNALSLMIEQRMSVNVLLGGL